MRNVNCQLVLSLLLVLALVPAIADELDSASAIDVEAQPNTEKMQSADVDAGVSSSASSVAPQEVLKTKTKSNQSND